MPSTGADDAPESEGGGTPGSRGDDLHRGRLELRGGTGSAGASLTDCTWEECER